MGLFIAVILVLALVGVACFIANKVAEKAATEDIYRRKTRVSGSTATACKSNKCCKKTTCSNSNSRYDEGGDVIVNNDNSLLNAVIIADILDDDHPVTHVEPTPSYDSVPTPVDPPSYSGYSSDHSSHSGSSCSSASCSSSSDSSSSSSSGSSCSSSSCSSSSCGGGGCGGGGD